MTTQQIKVSVKAQKAGGFKPVITVYEWPRRLWSETLKAWFVEREAAQQYGENYRDAMIEAA